MLRFDEIRFSLADDRPLYVNDVTFLDRATEEILIEGRVRGSGPTVPRRPVVRYVAESLTEATSQAASNLMFNLSRDMMSVIAERNGVPGP